MPRDGLVLVNGGELERKFMTIGRGLRSRAVNSLLTKASWPIIVGARARLVAGGHVDTGALKKSIGAVLRKYRNGTLRMAVIGPRLKKRTGGKKGFQGSVGHLLEFGTVERHALGKKTGFAKSIFRAATNLGRYYRGRIDPAKLAGAPFLRPAFHANKRKALKIMATEAGAIIDKLARKKS